VVPTVPARARPLLPAVATVTVLTVANILNNLVAAWAYVPTCVVATAVLLVLARRSGSEWADLGLARGTLRRGARWAGIEVLIVALLYLVVLTAPAVRGSLIDARASDLTASAVVYAALVRVPVATVLLEEIGFRGVLWAQVTRLRGTTWATAVSSALFALWHVVPATRLTHANVTVGYLAGVLGVTATVVTALVASGLAGAFLCELRRRSDSLLAPIGLHLATNTFAYLAAFGAARLLD